MQAALLLNGRSPGAHLLRRIAEEMPVYVADGGVHACLAAGVKPALVLGDLDSLGAAVLPADWKVVLAEDQAYTDLEKLLAFLPGDICQLTVVGALGGRMDHCLSNLITLAALPEDWEICLLTEREQMVRVTPTRPYAGEGAAGRLLSLLAPGGAFGVCSEGLRWELEEARLGPGLGLGQSNRSSARCRIRVREGMLWVWEPVEAAEDFR